MGQQIVMDLLAIHATNLTRRMPPRLQKPRRGKQLSDAGFTAAVRRATRLISLSLMRRESIGL